MHTLWVAHTITMHHYVPKIVNLAVNKGTGSGKRWVSAIATSMILNKFVF